jgi:hypothetical protein
MPLAIAGWAFGPHTNAATCIILPLRATVLTSSDNDRGRTSDASLSRFETADGFGMLRHSACGWFSMVRIKRMQSVLKRFTFITARLCVKRASE